MRSVTCILLWLLAYFPAVANAAEDKALLARKALSAFSCSTFASLAGKSDEQRRLFELGFSTGRVFVSALQAGEIPDTEMRTKVPMFLAMRLQGPSVDFIVGRVYEWAAGDAFDEVVKKDASGMLLNADKWVQNDELQRSIAEGKYSRQNCQLID